MKTIDEIKAEFERKRNRPLNKLMRSRHFTYILAGAGLLCLFIIMFMSASKTANRKKHIGEEVKIDNTTYTILSYDIDDDTFMLSNGAEVDAEFIIKH